MDVFAALSDPIRRRIVEALADHELTAGEIADMFPVSGPAISRHLRVLRNAGLVAYTADAQRRVYRLAPDALAEADGWMVLQLERWRARFDALGGHLDAMAERETRKRRTQETRTRKRRKE